VSIAAYSQSNNGTRTHTHTHATNPSHYVHALQLVLSAFV